MTTPATPPRTTRVRITLDLDVIDPVQPWRRPARLRSILDLIATYAATRRHVVAVAGGDVAEVPEP